MSAVLEDPVTEAAPEVAPEVLEEAKREGWRPREEWEGDPDIWIDAPTFVKRGKEINIFLRKNNERLQRELANARDEITRQGETLRDFGARFDKMQETAYNRAILELKAQIRVAKRNDEEGVDQLEEQLETLTEDAKELKAKPAPAAAQPNPAVFNNWKSENPWYDTDEALRFAADGVAMRLASTRRDLVGKPEFLEEVNGKVKALYPDKFRRKPSPPSPVDSGSSSSAGGGKKGGRGYGDLPPEAKAACDKYGRDFVGKGKQYETVDAWRKKYTENYDWSE